MADAGLNAYLPLLLSAVLDRLDVADLGEPLGALSSDAGIAVLAALVVVEAGRNPVLSLGEDAASLVLTIAAFALPLVAVLVVLALLAAVITAARRLRRSRRAPC